MQQSIITNIEKFYTVLAVYLSISFANDQAKLRNSNKHYIKDM